MSESVKAEGVSEGVVISLGSLSDDIKASVEAGHSKDVNTSGANSKDFEEGNDSPSTYKLQRMIMIFH